MQYLVDLRTGLNDSSSEALLEKQIRSNIFNPQYLKGHFIIVNDTILLKKEYRFYCYTTAILHKFIKINTHITMNFCKQI